jgi:hypothetical protein
VMSAVVMSSVVLWLRYNTWWTRWSSYRREYPPLKVQRSTLVRALCASVTFPHVLIGQDLLVSRDECEFVKPGCRHQQPIGGVFMKPPRQCVGFHCDVVVDIEATGIQRVDRHTHPPLDGATKLPKRRFHLALFRASLGLSRPAVPAAPASRSRRAYRVENSRPFFPIRREVGVNDVTFDPHPAPLTAKSPRRRRLMHRLDTGQRPSTSRHKNGLVVALCLAKQGDALSLKV